MTFTPITLTYHGQFKHHPNAEINTSFDLKVFYDNVWDMKRLEQQRALDEAQAQIDASRLRYDELQKKLDELEKDKEGIFNG